MKREGKGWMDGGREGGRGKGRSPDGIVAGGGVRQADDVASMRVRKHTVLLVVGVASESGVSLGGEAPVRLRGLHDQGGGGAAHEPRSEECHLNMSMAVSRGRTPAQCQCHEPPRTNRTANVAAVGTASRCQPAPVRVPTAVPAETVYTSPHLASAHFLAEEGLNSIARIVSPQKNQIKAPC